MWPSGRVRVTVRPNCAVAFSRHQTTEFDCSFSSLASRLMFVTMYLVTWSQKSVITLVVDDRQITVWLRTSFWHFLSCSGHTHLLSLCHFRLKNICPLSLSFGLKVQMYEINVRDTFLRHVFWRTWLLHYHTACYLHKYFYIILRPVLCTSTFTSSCYLHKYYYIILGPCYLHKYFYIILHPVIYTSTFKIILHTVFTQVLLHHPARSRFHKYFFIVLHLVIYISTFTSSCILLFTQVLLHHPAPCYLHKNFYIILHPVIYTRNLTTTCTLFLKQ
jgi:hypothetical protein